MNVGMSVQSVISRQLFGHRSFNMYLHVFLYIINTFLCSPVLSTRAEQVFNATKSVKALNVSGSNNRIRSSTYTFIANPTLKDGEYLEVYFSEFSVSDDLPACKRSSVEVSVKER